jgi:hypothetical protein
MNLYKFVYSLFVAGSWSDTSESFKTQSSRHRTMSLKESQCDDSFQKSGDSFEQYFSSKRFEDVQSYHKMRRYHAISEHIAALQKKPAQLYSVEQCDSDLRHFECYPLSSPKSLIAAVYHDNMRQVKEFHQHPAHEGFLDWYESDQSQFKSYTRGSHPNVKTGRSALHISAALNNKKIFEYLHHHGASINTVDRKGSGENIIHMLVRQGRVDWLYYLVRLVTASAPQSDHHLFIAMLLEETAECSQPLRYAIKYQQFEAAAMLLSFFKEHELGLAEFIKKELLEKVKEFLDLESSLKEQAAKTMAPTLSPSALEALDQREERSDLLEKLNAKIRFAKECYYLLTQKHYDLGDDSDSTARQADKGTHYYGIGAIRRKLY